MAVTINLNLPDEITVGTTDVVSGVDGTLIRNEGGKVGDTDYTIPKTDGTSGQVLTTNGAGVVSWQSPESGLTIGTTPITSGTVGRVLFEGSGNVLQEDSALFWDNTNKRLGVGATPSTSVRLDVRAQGALGSDIAFRVRNSANTADLFRLSGNGDIEWSDGIYSAGMQVFYSSIRFKYGGAGFGSRVEFNNSGIQLDYAGNISLGTPTNFGGGTGQIIVKTATAPTSNGADQFHLYSKDIVAGNAAPHFRTENGAVVKLYQETTSVAAATLVSGGGTALTDTDTFDGYTLKQIVKALRNQGLLA